MRYQTPHNVEHAAFPQFSDNWALFLDVDGTLLELAGRPHDVSLPAGLADVLESLFQQVPLALISGRRIADLDRLFASLVLPVAGQHGAERRSSDGRTCQRPVSRVDLEPARDILTHWAGSHPGVLLEDKGLTLALHYRLVPELKAEAAQVARQAACLLRADYEIIPGNMVWEVRPVGCDKGRAIAAFLDETPFCDRIPVFIGDDVGDEDGFSLLNSRGGHSFKVGAGQTAARSRFSDVGDVLNWLHDYAAWLASASQRA
ncbi:MAG: trehalose-phosphatase [Sulfurifustaceae bacterium]